MTPRFSQTLWTETAIGVSIELAESKRVVQEFLKRRNPAWNLVGRVHFNLAENRKDDEAPFAFLATYTTRLSAEAKAQHLPLGQALREYAGAANKARSAVAAAAGAARRRDVSVAEGDGRCGRDLSSAALDARRGVCSCCATCPAWKRRASSCACRRPGAAIVRRARR